MTFFYAKKMSQTRIVQRHVRKTDFEMNIKTKTKTECTKNRKTTTEPFKKTSAITSPPSFLLSSSAPFRNAPTAPKYPSWRR